MMRTKSVAADQLERPIPVNEMQLTESAMDHCQKTKQGISIARANGVKWGSYGAILAKQNKDAAQTFAESLRPLIVDLMAHNKCNGPVTLARAMNNRGVISRNGGSWHPNSVLRVMERLRPSLNEDVRQARSKIFENVFGQGSMENELLAMKYKKLEKG